MVNDMMLHTKLDANALRTSSALNTLRYISPSTITAKTSEMAVT